MSNEISNLPENASAAYDIRVSDYKVNTTTGEAFVSQREAARLCGVSQQAITKFLKTKINNLRDNQTVPELNEINDLGDNQITDSFLADMVIYYAENERPQAMKTALLFARAGARAFIYSQAGYTPPQMQPPPQQKPLQLTHFTPAVVRAVTYDLPDRYWGLLAMRELKARVDAGIKGQTQPMRPDGSYARNWKPRLNRTQFFEWCYTIVLALENINIPPYENAEAICAAMIENRLNEVTDEPV